MQLIISVLVFFLSIPIFAETTLYGKGHITLEKKLHATQLKNKSTFIGLKGLVAINENLVVRHVIELDLDITKPSSTLKVRKSFIGLKGHWGEFRVGLHDTPFEIIDDSMKSFLSNQESGLITDPDRETLLAYINKFGNYGVFVSYNGSNKNNNTVASAMLNHVKGPIYTGLGLIKESSSKAGAKFVLSYQKPSYAIGYIHKRCPSNTGVTVAEINQGACSSAGGDSVNHVSGVYHFGKPYVSGQIAKNNQTNIKKQTVELGYLLDDDTHIYLELDRTGNNDLSSLGLVTSF